MSEQSVNLKAKTNSFFEDIYFYLEFRGWRLSERRLDICIFQITLVSLQIMPGKGLPYWKIHESDLVNLYLVTIWWKSGNFKISSLDGNVYSNSLSKAICWLENISAYSCPWINADSIWFQMYLISAIFSAFSLSKSDFWSFKSAIKEKSALLKSSWTMKFPRAILNSADFKHQKSVLLKEN